MNGVICTTWFLPADYCGCAKCTGVTPPPIVGAGEDVPPEPRPTFDSAFYSTTAREDTV